MVLRFLGFELDQQRAELRGRDGLPIKLRPKTFEMLRLFATNSGRVISKPELMEAVWPNVHVGEDSLFQCIRELRVALGDDQRQIIKLASGGGYQLTAEVVREPVAEPTPVPDIAASPQQADASGPVSMAEPRSVEQASRQYSLFALRGRRAVAVAVIGLGAAIGLAVAAPLFRLDLLFPRGAPIVAVIPIASASADPRDTAMASEVTSRLTDGFAKVENIKLVTPPLLASTRPESAATPATPPDYEIRGELLRDGQTWLLRARIVKPATGEVQSVATISVDTQKTDVHLQQARLAAGVGHPLALRLNELLEASQSTPTGRSSTAGGTKVVIEQAIASINHTTRERFGVAQTMLQKALADEPDNVDIAVALSSLQLRGIQMVWYDPEEAVKVEAQASATLERALRQKPNSIPVLESSCRFLSATNHFVESLVTCSKILNFDPWNGGALYLIGLGQLNLGRFEDALATFQRATRYDTPAVSRWTWLLGVGWVYLIQGNGEEAIPWLEQSIAITAASGRPHMMLAAAYQQAGRLDDAKAAMQQGLKLRPGTTKLNLAPPMKNSSPVFVKETERVVQIMVDAGLPER